MRMMLSMRYKAQVVDEDPVVDLRQLSRRQLSKAHFWEEDALDEI